MKLRKKSMYLSLVCSIGFVKRGVQCWQSTSKNCWRISINHSGERQTISGGCNINLSKLTTRSCLTSLSQEKDEDLETDQSDTDILDVPKKRMVEVTSELELPFSAEVAYDAYSDLTRQPTWSSWLSSVEYLDDEKQNSKWTVKFMGLSYSWTAVAVKYERPHTIQWKSTSGLRNFGMVKFYPNEDNETTIMNVSISFVAPRAASALLRKSNKLTGLVQDKMVAASLEDFRDIVLETDLRSAKK